MATVLFASASCMLVSCINMPSPVSTGKMWVVAAGFLAEDGRIQYQMDFRLLDPTTEPMLVRVTFENPANVANPFIVEVPLAEKTGEFTADSPMMSCIDNRKYAVMVELMRADAVIDHLVQEVRFHMPSDDFKRTGLVRCSAA
jgi:hypothetical protein